MKLKILKLSVFCLVFALMGASCQDDDLITENYPFRLEYYIQNGKGEKVTKIKKGENFYIYFSMENISDKHWSISQDYQVFNGELFNIYKKSSSSIVGVPMELEFCEEIFGCLGEPHVKYEKSVVYPVENDTHEWFLCCGYKLSKLPELTTGSYFIKYTGSIPYYELNANYEVIDYETEDYDLSYEFEIIK